MYLFASEWGFYRISIGFRGKYMSCSTESIQARWPLIKHNKSPRGHWLIDIWYNYGTASNALVTSQVTAYIIGFLLPNRLKWHRVPKWLYGCSFSRYYDLNRTHYLNQFTFIRSAVFISCSNIAEDLCLLLDMLAVLGWPIYVNKVIIEIGV